MNRALQVIKVFVNNVVKDSRKQSMGNANAQILKKKLTWKESVNPVLLMVASLVQWAIKIHVSCVKII